MSRICAIWAQDVNGVLGTGTGMCWHVPADFKHFKETTMGSPIIMGRLSFEALGKALPGRTNIVVTSRQDYDAPNALVAHSIEQAIDMANHCPMTNDTIWITGGGHIYEQTMPIVDELVITHLDFDASNCGTHLVHAPSIDPDVWVVDPAQSDTVWREKSGDARWKCVVYKRA